MKRPAFQFYPADWRKDVALQACSLAAQGLWVNIMCLAHECEPYGHLALNGKPMTTAQIAKGCGTTPKECEGLLAELEDAGVSSKTDGGFLYSRRMVRDEALRDQRAETGRANGAKGAEFGAKGAEHGKKGGRPRGTNPGNDEGGEPGKEPPQNPRPSSSSSSSSSTAALPQAAAGVNPAAPSDQPLPPPLSKPVEERAIEISGLLRKAGAKLTGSDPRVLDWARRGISDAQLLTATEKAIEARHRVADASPINAGFIDKLLGDVIAARPTYDIAALQALVEPT